MCFSVNNRPQLLHCKRKGTYRGKEFSCRSLENITLNVGIGIAIEIETILSLLLYFDVNGLDMLNDLRCLYNLEQIHGFGIVAVACPIPSEINPSLNRCQLVETPSI